MVYGSSQPANVEAFDIAERCHQALNDNTQSEQNNPTSLNM